MLRKPSKSGLWPVEPGDHEPGLANRRRLLARRNADKALRLAPGARLVSPRKFRRARISPLPAFGARVPPDSPVLQGRFQQCSTQPFKKSSLAVPGSDEDLEELLAARAVPSLQLRLGERSAKQVARGHRLLVAAAAGDLQQCSNLLEKGAADPLQRDEAGNVALHLAASPEVALLLLGACPAAAGVENWAGQSPVARLLEARSCLVHWRIYLCEVARTNLDVLLKAPGSKRLSSSSSSLLGRLTPALAEEVRSCALAPKWQDVLEALELLPSRDHVSRSRLLRVLSRLRNRFPQGLEGQLLQHLVLEAPPAEQRMRLQACIFDVSKALLRMAVDDMLSEARCAEKFRRDDDDLPVCGLSLWLLHAASMPARTGGAGHLETSCRCSFAECIAELILKLSLEITTSNAADLADYAERDAILWLSSGQPAEVQSDRIVLPGDDSSGKLRTDAALNGEDREAFERSQVPHWVWQQDLEAARIELGSSVAELGEDLAFAYTQAISADEFFASSIPACEVAFAFLHSMHQWNVYTQAEREVWQILAGILESTQVPLPASQRSVATLEQIWHKALEQWPSLRCQVAGAPPALFVCDALAMDLELPGAAALRALHSRLLNLCWLRDGAELLAVRNGFHRGSSTSRVGSEDTLGSAGIAVASEFFLRQPEMKAWLLLSTSSGPVPVELRLRTPWARLARGPAGQLLRDCMLGFHEHLEHRGMWVKLLRLQVALQEALSSNETKALEAALALAWQALSHDPALRDFCGASLAGRLRSLGEHLAQLRQQERLLEDSELALQRREEAACRASDRGAWSGSALAVELLWPRPEDLVAASDCQEDGSTSLSPLSSPVMNVAERRARALMLKLETMSR
eukprot:TRINITY_DN16059_c0_g2_i1.p1 TRINITY_DN16059_c0_g2~~TRINITY_DN16059_c0_g2_i1.p1  ORF type:complete len:864 (+),score=196.61 TRINITY_DN16059_c0_g2_i1:36-2627(+)